MSDADFYNRNLYRAYPFTEPYTGIDTADFPLAAVVDFGIVFLRQSGFDPDDVDHKIFPKTVYRHDDNVEIKLQIEAAGSDLDEVEISVIASVSDEFVVKPFTVVLDGKTAAYGFVVVGKFDGLKHEASSSSANNFKPSGSFVERRCVQLQIGHFVHHFDVANEPRTLAPDRCPSQQSSSSSGFVNSGYATT